MTNSAPKMNNKVERQGSPNAGGKKQQNRGGTIKSASYYSNSANKQFKNNNSNIIINNNNNNNGRLSCSPPCGKNTFGFSSPLRYDSPRHGSPTNSYYAGAKFSEPPSPASLPKPPSHWTTRLINSCQRSEACCNFSNQLKIMLNVQA
ncbi:proline-rich nuclear receptor coactivator 2-like [Aphidius gifuensis]|uniref:proline-rich nuclear receptor coactivator 2-like n=1 Tax=Aphidius gifuensis TaxID=684658 RepID=UPI001CDCF2E7|nr:proline-rich nuclear receptor coactivator 2-like [Aphidius gifuensis]